MNHYDNRIPSTTFDAYWIYADNEIGNYQIPRGRDGKWLFFEPISSSDATWEKVRDATRAGQLGNTAKVSTVKPNRNAFATDTQVICVYTNDLNNVADVTRIKNAIRALDIDNKLIYKLNSDVGKYHKDGHRKLAQRVNYSDKYYEVVDWFIKHPQTKYTELVGTNQWGKQRYWLRQADLAEEVFLRKELELKKLGFEVQLQKNNLEMIVSFSNIDSNN